MSRDWHHERDQLIEVALSEAQWATFVSSFGVGGGVPCTLNHVRGEIIPAIPPRDQATAFRAEIPEALRHALGHLDRVAEGVKEMNISSKAKNALLENVRMAKQEIEKNLPFVAEQFDRHVETRIEKARIEIEAHLNARILSAGLVALSGSAPIEIEDRS